MKKLLFAILLIPSFVFSQTDTTKGIRFEQGLTWDQVKQKAKAENKFIFVDCFTTWCGPCKKMDNEVYTSEKVGSYMNNRFISVKLQMDTTAKDDLNVKAWYPTRIFFEREYRVSVFPSFIFFASNGEPIHRDAAYRDVDEFITIASESLDPQKQNLALLDKYKRGIKDYPSMAKLYKVADYTGRYWLANQIALDYKTNYLDHASAKTIATADNFEMIKNYTPFINSKDGFFKLMYNSPKVADSLASAPGFSKFVVDMVITKEEIKDKIYWEGKMSKVESPEWDNMLQEIKRKYKKVDADRYILDAKIEWFSKMFSWDEAIKYFVMKVDKYGLESLGMSPANSIIDMIVIHCSDKEILNKAVGWMDTLIKNAKTPTDKHGKYGGYAAILYKLNRVDEAITYMEKRISNLKQNYGKGEPCTSCEEERKIIERMKNGEEIDWRWDPKQFY